MAHMLRIRASDDDHWGPPTAYTSKRRRDRDEMFNRVIGGFRTHSWTETRAEQKAREAQEEAEGEAQASEPQREEVAK
jgi:hypothetical protein